MSSLGRKRKSITKDIISIGINDKSNHFRHRQNLRVRKKHEYFHLRVRLSFPPSECPPELAAGGRLCACKVWCYRKHRHSRYTDCPQDLEGGEVCSAFPGPRRNFRKGYWALHLETSLVIALAVSVCWKRSAGVAAWPRMGLPPPVPPFCFPHHCCWGFLQPGGPHSASLLWASPKTQKSTNKGKKARYLVPAGQLQHVPTACPSRGGWAAERAQGLELH